MHVEHHGEARRRHVNEPLQSGPEVRRRSFTRWKGKPGKTTKMPVLVGVEL